MILDGLCGPTNTLRSPNVDVERSVNGFPEITAPGSPKVNPSWIKRPGLVLRYDLGTNKSVRGLFEINDRAFAVSGPTLFELFPDFTAVAKGTVSEDSTPAGMTSNGSAGHQLLITSDGFGYILDLNTDVFTADLASSTDFPPDAFNPDFLNGYFMVQRLNTRQWNISNLENGLIWDALDVFERSMAADNIAQLIRVHREVWLFGNKTTEVWFPSTDEFIAFTPDQNALIEMGSAVNFAACRCDNTIVWIGRNENGHCVVYRMDGYTPKRVSTTAVEEALSSSTDIFESFSWTYQQHGHTFYGILVQDLPTSWYYDLSTGLWHERAEWDPNNSRFVPHVPRCHCFAFERHLVGDYRTTGAIYEMSTSVYDDGIVP